MRVCLRLFFIISVTVFLTAPVTAQADNTDCAESATFPSLGISGVTLIEAVQAALRHHPDLVVAECEIRAAEGRMVQAGLRPNPEAGVEVANVAGSRTRRGFAAAETTLQVSQLIELGGKRAKRLEVAGLERDLAAWDREAKRLDVITETRKAFIETLVAQERLGLFRELAQLSREVLHGVAGRVTAGKVSPIEEVRANVAVSRAELDLAGAKTQLEAARLQLAARWGAEKAIFTQAVGDLNLLPPRPALADVEDALQQNPDLARWVTEAQLRQRALELADAQGVPDVKLSGGVRQFAETDDVGLVIGLSVPIPLFNRNQGAIAAAQSRLTAAGAAQGATRLQLLRAVYRQYQSLSSAATEVNALNENVLPSARRVFEATTTGYRQGKFSYLEVLDAQRTLFEARSQYVDALARYHVAAAELERLTGTGLQQIESSPKVSNPGAQE